MSINDMKILGINSLVYRNFYDAYRCNFKNFITFSINWLHNSQMVLNVWKE